MNKLSTVDDVLDFAIGGEGKASELYMKMAAMVENPWISKTLEGLAEEELQHKKKLKAVKDRKLTLNRDQVGDLGIAKTLEKSEPHAKMDYRELLVYAIKKEGISQGLYRRMATIFSEPELRDMFLKLAEEEADHKRRFEMQYESLTP